MNIKITTKNLKISIGTINNFKSTVGATFRIRDFGLGKIFIYDAYLGKINFYFTVERLNNDEEDNTKENN